MVPINTAAGAGSATFRDSTARAEQQVRDGSMQSVRRLPAQHPTEKWGSFFMFLLQHSHRTINALRGCCTGCQVSAIVSRRQPFCTAGASLLAPACSLC